MKICHIHKILYTNNQKTFHNSGILTAGSMGEAVQLMLDQDQQFGLQFDGLLKWVADARHELQDQDQVSALTDTLTQQKSGFEVGFSLFIF